MFCARRELDLTWDIAVLGYVRKALTLCREYTFKVVKELVPPVPVVVSVAFSLGLGAASGTLLSKYPNWNFSCAIWILALSAGCLLLSAFILRSRWQALAIKRGAWWITLFGMTCAMCGWAWCCARLFPRNDLAWSLTDTPLPVLVQGVVVVGPKKVKAAENILDFYRQQKTSEWCLELHAVRNQGLWESVSGYARIFIDGEMQPLPVGSSVRVYGRAARPSAPLNPSEFDFQRHSQLKRVLTIVRVRNWSSVVFCRDKQTITLAGCIDWLHQRCLKRLHEIVPESNQPLASSLLLGAREALSQQTVNAFADTGSAHILAISGLHIGLVATAVFYVLRLFGCSLRISWLIVIIVVTIYACLTGGAIPVVRATMLMWVAGLGVWTRRRFVGLHALAIVGIVLLLWSPASIVSVGMLLSFLATAVLISLGVWCRDHWGDDSITQLAKEKRSWIQRILYRFFDASRWFVLLSASVWIVSVPLVIVGFHRFVPIAIGTNILIAPLLPCVMASGFVCLVSVFLPVSVCKPLGDAAGFFFDLLERVVEMLASIPGSSVRAHTLPTWWVLCWYIVIVLFLLQLCYQAKLVKRRHAFGTETVSKGPEILALRRKILVFGVILLGVGMLGISLQSMPKTFQGNRIIVSSMGHGCGIVIKTEGGQCLVYDAGRIGASGAALRSLRAVLNSEGIHTIQSLVLSHADTDHFNAVPGILKEFRVEQVIVSPHFLRSSSRSARRVHELFVELGVPIRTVLRGDVIPVGLSCTARVLHPQCTIDTA
ncbi:MAG: DUF4131 domain-containing protein, partial [Planctomycetaceae bacterium]|nr:DUF4131 domain-containing protein [Planctomycetaceae bacterium]